MFFRKKEKPEVGELVICTVKKILPHAAFVDLDEYENLEAMLHISEISSKWIKNIRDHLSKGEKIVCKILEIKPKGYIDVSLKRVTSAEKKRKLNELKIEQKMEKLIEIIAKKLKEDPKRGLEKVGGIIVNKFGSLYNFYLSIKKDGVDIIKELNLPKKWENELIRKLSEYLKSQFVKIVKEIKLFSFEGDGIERLKRVFKKIYRIAKKEKITINMEYISSPRYRLEISTKNYKEGEIFIEKLFSEIGKYCKKEKVEFMEG